MKRLSKRKITKIIHLLFVLFVAIVGYIQLEKTGNIPQSTTLPRVTTSDAGNALALLEVKGRAPKTGYTRTQFSEGWAPISTCDVRNLVLARDMVNVTYVPKTCNVASGTLNDPYTGKTVSFVRGPGTSTLVQIDHVVSLSDAWQKGAQQLPATDRFALANDMLNLLAVDGAVNQAKGDGDAATWLPPNKLYRCSYVARQIAIKQKYGLWVTAAEYRSMATVLASCPGQVLPTTPVTPLLRQ